jgi:hypothetical protein
LESTLREYELNKKEFERLKNLEENDSISDHKISKELNLFIQRNVFALLKNILAHIPSNDSILLERILKFNAMEKFHFSKDVIIEIMLNSKYKTEY